VDVAIGDAARKRKEGFARTLIGQEIRQGRRIALEFGVRARERWGGGKVGRREKIVASAP